MKTIIDLKRLILLAFILVSVGVSAQTVMDVDAYRDEFNSLSDKMRVVVTNDPGCGGCMYMVQQLMDVFEDPQGCGGSPDIRFFFNWTKVLSTTELAMATQHTSTWPDSRFIHYWDEFQIMGDLHLTSLGLIDPSGTGEYSAWHTVQCFAPGVVWDVNDATPPQPTFWQHKLSTTYNADQNLYMTEISFAEGFNQLACATSVADLSGPDSKVRINKSYGSGDFEFKYTDLAATSTLTITSIDGRSIIVYPLADNSGTLILSQKLNSGLYLYSLIENGSIVGSAKFVVTN